jgi:hypothetical protein
VGFQSHRCVDPASPAYLQGNPISSCPSSTEKKGRRWRLTDYAYVKEAVREGQSDYRHVVIPLNVAPSPVTVAAPDLQGDEKHDEDVCEYSNSIEALAESRTVILSVTRLPSVVFSGTGIARDP